MPLIAERRPNATVLRGSEAGYVPFVRCEHCGEHIGLARDGEVQWSRAADPGKHVVFLHGTCVDEYRRLHEQRHGSMGLAEFVRALGAGLDVDVTEREAGSRP